jgi:hypothetical protein
VDGTSPLTLETRAPEAVGPVVVWGHFPNGPLETYVTYPQDFWIEGTLTVERVD